MQDLSDYNKLFTTLTCNPGKCNKNLKHKLQGPRYNQNKTVYE